MTRTTVVLKDLIEESKDGEWGDGEPSSDAVEMLAIRATDFGNVAYGDIHSVPHRFIARKAAERKTLGEGDIVLEVAGGGKNRTTGRALLLRPSVFRDNGVPITCASFCRFIRINKTVADPAYIYWHLTHLYRGGHLDQFHVQHTGVSRFQYTAFATGFRFKIPPLQSQRKIAAILSAYDDLIENNRWRIEILEEMAQAIYREWFVELRFPGYSEARMVDSSLGRIPETWSVVCLSDVAEVNARSIKPADAPERIVYIDIASVSTRAINARKPMVFAKAPGRARRIVRHGDIIWSCVRPNLKSFALIQDPEADQIVSTGFAVVSPVRMPFTYLYEAITTDAFADYLTNRTRGAAYPAVSAGDFEDAEILRPDDQLLAQFNEIVEPMLALAERLRTQNMNLRDTLNGLLPKLISGEVDVSKLEIKEDLACVT